MTADASIYGMIRQPAAMPQRPSHFDQMGAMLQLRNLMDSGDLNALQLQKGRADMEEERAFKSALGQLADLSQPLPAEAVRASPSRAAAFQKQQLDSQKSRADLEKTKLESMAAESKFYRDAASQVRDQAGWDAFRQMAASRGAKFAEQLPPQFSPEAQRSLVMTADKFIEQSTPKMQEVKIDNGGRIEVRFIDTNPLTNPGVKDLKIVTDRLASPDSRLSADTTRRGQDITDRRERDVVLASDIAAAREGGKTRAEAQAALPGVISDAERGLRLIDDLIGSKGKTLGPGEKDRAPHPGFQSAVGASVSKVFSPFWAPPGTDRRDFEIRMNEIKGGAFLQAFEKLKGAGQITEIEGTKATQAINRMETAQSEGEFVKAAREFQDVIRSGVEKARGRAGASGQRVGSGGIRFLGFEGQ